MWKAVAEYPKVQVQHMEVGLLNFFDCKLLRLADDYWIRWCGCRDWTSMPLKCRECCCHHSCTIYTS